MAAYAAAQHRLEAGGGYRWRDQVLEVLRGLGFDARAGRAPALDLLRRRADPGLAGPGAGDQAGPAAARRAHQPPRHPLAGVAGGLPGRARRRRRPGRPRSLVPGGGRHLGAGAGGAAGPLLRRALARLAPGAGGAPDRARQGDRPPAGRDRADGEIRRALPLQGDQGQTGAVADQTDRQEEEKRAAGRTPRHAQTALLLQAARAARPGGAETRQRQDRGAGADAPRRCPARSRARRARRPGRRQRQRQDDPDRDPGGPPRAGLGQRPQRPQRQARLPLPARRHGGGGGHRARRRPARDRPRRAQGAGPARRLPLLRQATPRSSSATSPAASSGGSRWRSWSPPAPTS